VNWTISDEEQRANVERKRREERQVTEQIHAQHEMRKYPKHPERKPMIHRHQNPMF
jgi:hypothetical protein